MAEVKYETDSKVLFDIRTLLQQILQILEDTRKRRA